VAEQSSRTVFFSSRRRHTRCSRDWSSDVCSSDLFAPSDLPVLVTGETGVGKELVVRMLHQRSARATAPLVYVNCAALPDAIAEKIGRAACRGRRQRSAGAGSGAEAAWRRGADTEE